MYLASVHAFDSRCKDYTLGKEDRIENPLAPGEETYQISVNNHLNKIGSLYNVYQLRANYSRYYGYVTSCERHVRGGVR